MSAIRTMLMASLVAGSLNACAAWSWFGEPEPAVLADTDPGTLSALAEAVEQLMGVPVRLSPTAFVDSPTISIEPVRHQSLGGALPRARGLRSHVLRLTLLRGRCMLSRDAEETQIEVEGVGCKRWPTTVRNQ